MTVKEHPKNCECKGHVRQRVNEYLSRIYDQSKAVPVSVDQTIPVRAHWRKHPGHLRKLVKTRRLLKQELARLIRTQS